MKVVTAAGATIDLGTTETTPTISITDYSRRVTDDFGATTVVERGFARRLSVRLAVPFDGVDALQRRLADLRATEATWVADDRFAWLSAKGFYRDFELDLAVPPISFCTLTVEGFAETEVGADPGGDPAPVGLQSTLRLLQPITVTDAALLTSSVAENDAPAWAAASTYAKGARVMRDHQVYESLIAGNVGAEPAKSPAAWLTVGPTNRWAMFDDALGTATEADRRIEVTVSAGRFNAIALLDVAGATVRVRTTGYDRMQAVSAGATTFLDMPAGDAQMTVTIAGPGAVSVGTLLIGTVVRLGATEAAPTAGITDYSRKAVDDFGEVTIVKRAWAKRMTARALIDTSAIDAVANRIAAVRARPSLWIGQEGIDSLSIYGFFKDFSIEVGETVSKLALSIEGMSQASKIEPITGKVDWPDVGDPNGTKPKDNADETGKNTSKDTAAVGGRPSGELINVVDLTKKAVETAQADVVYARSEIVQARTDLTAATDAVRKEVTAARGDVTQARADITQARSDLATEVQRAKDDTASIRRVQEQVQTDLNGAVSRIGTEETNRASADSALANRASTVEAQMRGETDSALAAAVRDEATARTNADSALAARSTSLEAAAENMRARVVAEELARANADSALVSRNSAIEAKFNASGDRKLSVVAADSFVATSVGDPTTMASVGTLGYTQYGPHVELAIPNATNRSLVPTSRASGQTFKLRARLWQVAGTATMANWYVEYLDANYNSVGNEVIGAWYSIENYFLQVIEREHTALFIEGAVWMRYSVLMNRKPSNPASEFVAGAVTRVLEASVENITAAKVLNVATNARIGAEEIARADAVSALASRNSTLEAQVTGTVPSGLQTMIKDNRKNLANVGWWKAGAAIPWSPNAGREDRIFTLPDGTDWGAPVTGPDGSSTDVWLARADTREQEGGGWNGGVIAPLDPDKTYRFMIPMIGLGAGYIRSFFWGTVGVCTLNTTTPHDNAYFASYRTTLANEWLLFVGYVFPRNSTGKTHEGSGIWNMRTGEFLGTGANWCFRPDGAQLNHRAYQYYATPGAYQAFGRPIVELVDGTESNFEAALKAKSGLVLANARIASEETARANGDSALAARASTLESRVGGHNSADIVARIATEEASRASADAAIASRSTALEAYSGKSVGLLSNPTYAKLSNRAPRSLPDYWHTWEDSASNVRQWDYVAGVESNNAYYDVVQAGQGQGIYQDARAGAGWYVVEATIQIADGSQSGAGVLLYGLDVNKNYVNAASVKFGVDKPIGETPQYGVRPDGVTGYSNVLRYSKLIQLDGNNAGSRVEYVRVYAMSNYAGDGFSSSYKAIVWHACNIRRASDAEIAGNKALPIAEGAVSRITTEETARANADSALAGRASTLEAQMRGATDSALAAAVRDEANARTNADSAISGRLSTVEASYASKSDLVARDMDFDFDATIPANQAWCPTYYGGGDLDPRITKTVAWNNLSCLYFANYGLRTEVYSRKTIPINPALKYRMKTRCGAYLTGGSGNTSRFYIGFVGLDAYGNVVDHGGYGSYRYAIVTGEAIADGQLVERSVVVTGEGNDSWLKFPPGTRQIRPLIFMNYDQNNVHSYVDYISIEEVTEIDARVTEEATARASADSGLASRAATLEAQFRGEIDSTIAARIRDEATARAGADSALATRASNVEARAGGLEARTAIVETSAVDSANKLAAARVSLTAVSPGGVATFELFSSNAGGAGYRFGGNGTFVGQLDIASAESGGRMVLRNDVLRVFDDSGGEAITLGRLS